MHVHRTHLCTSLLLQLYVMVGSYVLLDEPQALLLLDPVFSDVAELPRVRTENCFMELR